MHKHRGSTRAGVLMMGAAVILACTPSDRPGGANADKCADYNGNPFKRLKGSLLGKSKHARDVAKRLMPRGTGMPHDELGREVMLTPICENSRLDDGQLLQGRFVALLTGPGTAPRFSEIPDDSVLWWVFGEEIRRPGGRDTIWHAEFLSMKAPLDVPYVVVARMQDCPKPDGSGYSADTVDWHPDVCPAATHVELRSLGGDKPWFGCTRGCCYAAMPTLRLDLDSLPADSLAPDTTRDTTRSPTGA